MLIAVPPVIGVNPIIRVGLATRLSTFLS